MVIRSMGGHSCNGAFQVAFSYTLGTFLQSTFSKGYLWLKIHGNAAAHPTGEPTADAELQRPAAAALANLCSEVSLAEHLVQANGMQALAALSESQDRQVQVGALLFWPNQAVQNPMSNRTLMLDT